MSGWVYEGTSAWSSDIRRKLETGNRRPFLLSRVLLKIWYLPHRLDPPDDDRIEFV